jgi:hypothetical protein
LATAALSTAYYPPSDRGGGLVLTNFLIGTAERATAGLVQEFVLSKFTTRGGKTKHAAVHSPNQTQQ